MVPPGATVTACQTGRGHRAHYQRSQTHHEYFSWAFHGASPVSPTWFFPISPNHSACTPWSVKAAPLLHRNFSVPERPPPRRYRVVPVAAENARSPAPRDFTRLGSWLGFERHLRPQPGLVLVW